MSVPQDYLDRPVAVIGAGTLGRRVALMFATRGGLVRINARRAEIGAAAVDFVEQQIGGLAGTHPGWARGRVEHVARLEDAVADAWLVIESVPERLELKQEIFAQLESAAPRDTILASNSSSYASRLIVDGLSTTDRMLNTHFYMPPTQIAVDVMSCGNTSQAGAGLRPGDIPPVRAASLPGAARKHRIHLQPDLGRDQTRSARCRRGGSLHAR